MAKMKQTQGSKPGTPGKTHEHTQQPPSKMERKGSIRPGMSGMTSKKC